MSESKSRIAWEYHIDTSFMDNMEPISSLNQLNRVQLFKTIKRDNVAAGETLSGENERNWLTYVVEGEVVLDGVENQAETDSSGIAKHPLFYPDNKGTARVTKDALLLRFDMNMYRALSFQEEGQQVVVDDVEMSDIEAAVFSSLMIKGAQGGLEIPSIPDIALRVSKASSTDDVDINKISKIILNDPVLCAKIIQYANSAEFGGMPAVKSISTAMMRMGLKTVKNLAMSYAVSDVFKQPSSLVAKRVGELFQHSMFISVLSYLFSKRYKKLDPEYALLLGLVHEIGFIPILNFMVSHEETELDEATLNSISDKFIKMISAFVLGKWGFDQDMVKFVDEGVNYTRLGEGDVDYVDLLNVAHWCYEKYVNSKQQEPKELPEIEQIPAFRKLGIEYLTDEEFQTIIDEANKTSISLNKLLV